MSTPPDSDRPGDASGNDPAALRRARFATVQEAFNQALDLPQKDRGAFLRTLKQRDGALGDQVEALLAAEPVASELLEPVELAPEPGSSATAVDPASRFIGQRLDQYELLEELGRGSAGVVYRARDIHLDREVAVKVLSGPLVSEEMRERFSREARTASNLSHPGIVPVLAAGEAQGRPYFVMELVPGRSLREHLEGMREARRSGQPLPEGNLDLSNKRVAADLVRRVALALAHAHARGVVHRDIKPANILIDRHGWPLLADFGLAKTPLSKDLTKTGELFGTPHYMSPEQAQSLRHRIDHRTDIYSLGAVLYELLADRPPPSGDTLQAVLHNIVHERPRPLRQLVPDAPPELILVCMQALRYRAERRYQDGYELARDLDRFLERQPVEADRPTLRENLEERFRSRRAFLKLVPVAVLLGAVGMFLGREAWVWQARRAARPQLNLTLSPADLARGVKAYGRRLDPDNGLVFGPAEPLGPLTELVNPLRLDPGDWRVVLSAEDGSSAEFTCFLSARETLALEPRLSALDAVQQGMVSVPGGVAELSFSTGEKGALIDFSLPVEPFLIDRACVTFGEFQAFLAATSRQLPNPEGPLAQLVLNERDPAFLALPVVGIDLQWARAYAAWVGKRLPTLAEWQVAVGGPNPDWLPRDFAQVDRQSVILGLRDSFPEQLEDKLAQFRGACAPAREAEPGQGPFGLFRAIGNVWQYTDSPALTHTQSGQASISRGVGLVGLAWTADPSGWWGSPPTTVLTLSGSEHSLDVGFRCARSLDPIP